MAKDWNDSVPIYRQLYEQVVESILKGNVQAGEPLRSVRQVSSDYQINHLTVAKSYQLLVDEGLVEKRRGVGMFVLSGAQDRLLQQANEAFIEYELPNFVTRANSLGLTVNKLIEKIKKISEEK